MSERGMKKWVSYRALVEQASALSKTHQDKKKVEKPLISNEAAEEINEILVNYHGEELKITKYYDGFLYEIKTTLSKIDPIDRCVILPDRRRIYFKEIIKIEKIN